MIDSPIVSQILWVLLLIEGVLAVILIVPFANASKIKIIIFISKIESSSASYVANVAGCLLLLVFIGNLWTSMQLRTGANNALSDGQQIMLLSAQCDAYLCGFALFMLFMLRLIYGTMGKNNRLQMSLTAMEKQAKGASDAFKNMMTENQNMEKQIKKFSSLSGDNDEINVQDLIDENAEMEEKSSKLADQVRKKEQEVDTIKKQAQKQQEAFMDMMNRNEKLQKKLQDFEDMMGDVAKKQT